MFVSPDLLSVAVEQCAETIMVADHEGTIVYVNSQFVKTTGYTADYALGRHLGFLRSGKTPRKIFVELWAALEKGEAWEGEFISRRKDGSEYVEHSRISPIEWEGGDPSTSYYLAIKKDITAKKQSEEDLSKLAYTDSLTGLPNRILFQQELNEAVSAAQADRSQCALLYMDLNRFKEINDTLGHDAGDQILCEAGKRFQSALDGRGLLSRLSGDEFVILLRDTTSTQAEAMAQRLQESLEAPVELGDQKPALSVSIGIALSHLSGSTSNTMFKHADIAMYHAKYNSLGYSFYTCQMEEAVVRKVLISDKLTTALEEGNLHLHYQPIIELKSEKLSGVEALLRWYDPDLGPISPAEFIPIAECRNMIEDISDWLLRETAGQYRKWLSEGFEFTGRISINLSERELAKANRVDDILSLLAQLGVPPEIYEIELTESAFINDKGFTQQNLDALACAGMIIAIDDFGTGHSALWQLRTQKVDKLKIDHSFIHKMEADKATRDIVEAITAMASLLDLKVIAEGVENQHQVELLKDIKCYYAQGYHFAKPLCAQMFAEGWLSKARAVA
ncbi:EAL domain-containing protein [Pseudovibrio sp. Tun.PSC04-5.I4]|uniref:putative bifunctional diguanylate cyclase/phosphodiesterase n=1 Tax=Pseudovibrio sp. Tun.PSC04-5.I4 TaxID=1798213 RepID=UPI00089121AF|nr:EAL domain-containing protein [Pseudovibrio sp. Tun.PSC04-5.I4]SDQ16145.1 PAS domain S-box-containing protein/diguanylate cyclase (GGDEF) domain-containing protein [Pseudovibrio sp. Tun.PSC04-5.I4]